VDMFANSKRNMSLSKTSVATKSTIASLKTRPLPKKKQKATVVSKRKHDNK
jgi:hypothetical protein